MNTMSTVIKKQTQVSSLRQGRDFTEHQHEHMNQHSLTFLLRGHLGELYLHNNRKFRIKFDY